MLEGRTLLACSVDFHRAYKHAPLLQSQGEFAKIVFAQVEGEPPVASLRTQPFGSRMAPANLGRVTQFIKFVLLKLFGTTLIAYVFLDLIFVRPEIRAEVRRLFHIGTTGDGAVSL